MSKNSLYKYITVFGTIAFLFCFYSKVILSPNSYLFSNTNDGIKNYYTYTYFISHNKSGSNFEGFNYPYGENILYTDCHPIFATTFKSLAAIFPSIKMYSIGILNSFMLFSILLSAYILFLLLKELKVAHFLAMLGAIAITALSPQIFRLQGHFALSYSFAIPLTLLFLIRYIQNKNNTKQLFYLATFHALLLFVHAYLGIICISILVSYFLIDALLNRFNLKSSWSLILSSIVSIIPFLTYKSITDFHQFRTNNPYGFFEYYADIDTVFLPNQGPWQEFLFSFLPSFTQTWEGLAYIGFGTILLSPFIIFHFFRKFNRKSNIAINKLLLAATLLLLFSFGIPFRFGLENWLEYFPFLKQFRAIGRFAWVFYFVISIYSFYLINAWIKLSKSKYLKTALIICLPVLMIAESIPFHQNVGREISQAPNSFRKNQLSDDFKELLNQFNPQDYQAIIPLPFYNIGCENFEKETSGNNYTSSMLLSYHSSLPLTSNHLSRSSLKESMNSMQMMAPNYYPKTIKNDINSKLPFLVLFDKSAFLNNYEQTLWNNTQLIAEEGNLVIGSLTYNSLFKNTAKQEIVSNISDSSKTLKNGFVISDSTKFFESIFFEKISEIPNFRNHGSKEIDKQAKTVLYTIAGTKLKKEEKYTASIWLSRLSENYGQDDLNHLEIVVEEKNSDGKVLQTIKKEVMSTFIHFKNWSMIEISFSILSNENNLEIYIIGNSPQPKITYAADFLLRNMDLNIYKVLEKDNLSTIHLYKNNHSIEAIN